MSPDVQSPQLRTKAAGTKGDNSSYYDNHDFGSVWLQSFLEYEKGKNDARRRQDLSQFIELPGSLVHPHAQNHLQQVAKHSGKISHRHHEGRFMRDLRKTLLGNKRQQSKNQVLRGRSTEGPLPYVEANNKISRVLKHMKLKTNKEDMQASQLNEFYKLVQNETAAAIVLQSHCRRVLATEHARQFALETSQAIKIQCFVRQFIARHILQELQSVKLRATKTREILIRIYVARYQRRKQMKSKLNAAVTCQSTVRMYFAKRLLRAKKLQYSWDVNKTRWKIISLRLAFSDMRLIENLRAIQIQSIVRRRLAQKRVASMHLLHTKAAQQIQCHWRRFDAQQRTRVLLYERSIEQRCNKLRIFSSEHNYWMQKTEELKTKSKLLIKSDLELQKANLMDKRRQKNEEIHVLEKHYYDQFDQLQKISPQEVEGGWKEQLKLNLVDARERITKAKLEWLFDIQLKLKYVEKQLNAFLLSEKEAVESFNHWDSLRQAEQDALWNFQRQHDDEIEEKEKRKCIIDEKLRWAVKFYAPSGKPDKRAQLVVVDSDLPYDRIKTLTDATALQINKVQEMNHLSRTWMPFQKMFDQFNEGSLFEGLYRNAASQQRSENEACTSSSSSILRGNYAARGATLDPFPQKLPWYLLKEVRAEREKIERVINKQ